MYADDLLLYIRNITADLTPIWTILAEFAEASGLKVNWDKSTIYPLHPNLAPQEIRIGTQSLP